MAVSAIRSSSNDRGASHGDVTRCSGMEVDSRGCISDSAMAIGALPEGFEFEVISLVSLFASDVMCVANASFLLGPSMCPAAVSPGRGLHAEVRARPGHGCGTVSCATTQ